MSKEADSRIIIDRKLREAGWNVEDKTQVATEEAVKDGRADYLLLDGHGKADGGVVAVWCWNAFV